MMFAILYTQNSDISDTWQYWVSLSTILSGLFALAAVLVSIVIYMGQKKQQRQQLVLPLYDYLSKLNLINPAAPVIEDVLNAKNALELIAVTCTYKITDKRVLLRIAKRDYQILYNQICEIKQVPGYKQGMTGKRFLGQSPIIGEFYSKEICR